MALYRFLFAPVLLAIAAVLSPPPPSSAPPQPSEQRLVAPATPASSEAPAARERATARPVRAP